MHIPDSHLCPISCMISFITAAPFWYLAYRNSKKSLKSSFLPVISIGAVFAFLVMLFDLRLPGGATGHAIGTPAICILFGPWVATLSTSIALFIQAFIFQDGGITALGANSIAMAIAPSFITYFFYKTLTGLTNNLGRKTFAATLSGYFSLVIAAITVSLMYLIQPGSPSIAVSALIYEHLYAFGWLEGIITSCIALLLLNEKSPLFKILPKKGSSIRS